MASNSISKVASIVNKNKPIDINFLPNNIPAVLSTEVGLRFQKRHSHILRDIERIHSQVPKIFFETNFGLQEHEVVSGFGIRKEKAYLLTRDAFSLLVMGFTGKAALLWKLKYIEAFNSLEATVLHNQTELAHQAGYQQGIDEARALPATESERKAAYLQGMKEGKKLQKRRDGLALTRKAVAYRNKGLSLRETARLLDMPKRTLADLLVRARTLGVQA